mmetsp:Transcript_9121/g.20431  ORF Transcript_9121/g.20431 Transcript_9121/m.20431 type:complete len:315 (-) Transcript_9121:1076-2020(-)
MGGALTSPDKDPPLVCGELPSELKILSTAASASVTMAAGLAPLVLGSALPLTAAFFAAGPPRAGCGMSPACSAGLLLGGLRPAPGDSLGCSLLVPGLLLGGLRAAPGGSPGCSSALPGLLCGVLPFKARSPWVVFSPTGAAVAEAETLGDRTTRLRGAGAAIRKVGGSASTLPGCSRQALARLKQASRSSIRGCSEGSMWGINTGPPELPVTSHDNVLKPKRNASRTRKYLWALPPRSIAWSTADTAASESGRESSCHPCMCFKKYPPWIHLPGPAAVLQRRPTRVCSSTELYRWKKAKRWCPREQVGSAVRSK